MKNTQHQFSTQQSAERESAISAFDLPHLLKLSAVTFESTSLEICLILNTKNVYYTFFEMLYASFFRTHEKLVVSENSK